MKESRSGQTSDAADADVSEVMVRIDALSYGRAAIGRVDGKVVFVERAAPGDVVRARVTADRGSYFEADLVEVVEPSPARVAPPCPLFDACGGCTWQHVAYDEQLRAKRQSVTDALTRIAGLDDPPVAPVIASERTTGYRNRLKLRFEHGRIGFYRAQSHSLVPIDDCLIAEDRVRGALAGVEAFLATLETRVLRVELAARGELGGIVVAINSAGRLRRADVHRIREFLGTHRNAVRGIVMWGRGWRRHWGDTRRRYTIAESATIETRGASFGQVNTEGNAVLVDTVLEAVALASTDTVLDLYAGAGNFSLPMARRCRRVDAVEHDSAAVEAGRESAAHQRVGNLDFHVGRVERFVAELASKGGDPPDQIVVNPPRDGLGETTEAIARLGAPRITYVSCNPTTLARDVKTLVRHGYSVGNVVPIDLFPHTFHVESVCHALLT